MTIIVLHNNFPNLSFNNISESVFYTLPETVQQKNGKPFFIPEFAEPCQMELHFAVRISRLGRNISERFAHRYFDAATVVPHFFAPSLLEDAQKNGLPWSTAMGFDASMPIGDFLPLNPEEVQQQSFHLTVDGEEVMKGSTADMLQTVDATIAKVSRYYTLRRGDLLLMGTSQNPVSIELNHRVETFLNDENVLSFNVK